MHFVQQPVALTSVQFLLPLQLLAAQFAAARHVNNLAVMRACHTESIACGVPVSESMAREALSVFLFWGDHASVSGIFEALEQTQGAQRVTVLAGELLSVGRHCFPLL